MSLSRQAERDPEYTCTSEYSSQEESEDVLKAKSKSKTARCSLPASHAVVKAKAGAAKAETGNEVLQQRLRELQQRQEEITHWQDNWRWFRRNSWGS